MGKKRTEIKEHVKGVQSFLTYAKFVALSLPLRRKEIKNAPSALLSYISTWEFLRTREKCGEAPAEGECLSHFFAASGNSSTMHEELSFLFLL